MDTKACDCLPAHLHPRWLSFIIPPGGGGGLGKVVAFKSVALKSLCFETGHSGLTKLARAQGGVAHPPERERQCQLDLPLVLRPQLTLYGCQNNTEPKP